MTVPIRSSPSGPLVETIDPSFNPLASVAYVDRLTEIPLDEQNGSPLAPFSTIGAAIAALALTGGTILVEPNDYTSEGSLSIGAVDLTIASLDAHPNYVFGSVGPGSFSVVGFTQAAATNTLNLIGARVTGAITNFAIVTLDSCFLAAAALTANALDAIDCRFIGTSLAIAIGMSIVDSELDAVAITSVGAIICRLIDCELFASFSLISAPTGTLRLCGRTNFFLQSITQTLTNVSILNQDTPGLNPAQPASIAASGALGVVSLGNMTSGGVLVFQPSGNYTIDGFTARSNGFWFDLLVDSTNQALVGQVLQDVGATTTSVRCPYNIPYQLVAGTTTRFRWQFNRWRVASPSTPSAQALISVAVPALAAAALGYVDVSLVGTALAGAPAGSQIIATPQADLAAAGANQGHYVGARVSATSTVRLAFVGTLAGGNVNFLFTRL
jgi:hypothetical protein